MSNDKLEVTREPVTPARESLRTLLGRQLSAVTFVQDYVQLHFDGPVLTAITHPRVEVRDTVYEWASAGYRDALCSCIGRVVREALVLPDQAIQIHLDDDRCISVSLEPEDYVTIEAARFDDALEDTRWVW